MKTLNQIVAEVENWASSHLQVHSFGQGDIWEISPSSSQFTFPLMWVTVGQSDPREMEMVDQFNVLVCDLVDTGEKNELEVLSDTRQILRDLVAWYRQQHSAAYIVEFQGSITPFTERFAERVSGHALTIRLRQPYDYDSCAIPLGTPIPAPPFCEPATFTLINTATPPATLDSGSIPSGGSEVIVAPPATVRLVDTDDNELLQDSIPSGVMTDVTAPDATLKLNNSLTTYPIRSGELYNMLVRLNGQVPQTFSYAPLTKTLNVISPPCADGTVEINGDQVATVPSGGMVNIMVEQDGNPVGAFDPNSNSWVIPPCGAGGSVSLAISNTSPNVGDTITLTATANFAATNFYFFARQGNDLYQIGQNSTGVLNWQVNIFGTFSVFVQADDNTVGSFNVGGSSVTSSSSTITAGLQLWLHPALSGIVPPLYPDLSTFNRDGTLVNSPTVVTGAGGYVDFNGVNQAVENIGGLADFAFIQNTLQFTIGAWIYVTDLTGRNPIAGNGVTSAERGFFMLCPDTIGSSPVGALTKALWISINRGVVANTINLRSADNIITTLGWNYITVTMNGLGTGQIYLNGQPITTTEVIQGTAQLSTGNSTRTLSVGRVTNSPIFFTGRIAPVQIYDRALTAQEVEDNFDADKFQYGF